MASIEVQFRGVFATQPALTIRLGILSRMDSDSG